MIKMWPQFRVHYYLVTLISLIAAQLLQMNCHSIIPWEKQCWSCMSYETKHKKEQILEGKWVYSSYKNISGKNETILKRRPLFINQPFQLYTQTNPFKCISPHCDKQPPQNSQSWRALLLLRNTGVSVKFCRDSIPELRHTSKLILTQRGKYSYGVETAGWNCTEEVLTT